MTAPEPPREAPDAWLPPAPQRAQSEPAGTPSFPPPAVDPGRPPQRAEPPVATPPPVPSAPSPAPHPPSFVPSAQYPAPSSPSAQYPAPSSPPPSSAPYPVPAPLPAPASEPPALPAAEHPHPASPLVRGWITLVAIVVILAHNVTDASQGLHAAGVLRLVALAAIVVVLSMALGFVRWRTTWFLISDTELRIERRFIVHSVDRIPFTRIQSVNVVQPFAARLLGLAALRIDVGAKSGHTIEFLPRSRAYRMRDYLLARAHGTATTLSEAAALPQADAWHDRAVHDEVVFKVRLTDLIITAVLSPGFLISLAWVVLAVVLGVAAQGSPFVVLVGGALPAVLGAAETVNRRVLTQVNFELTRSERGVRAAKGLTSLTSESLPIDRIQGIAVHQNILWRPFGLYQVRMDVLGSRREKEDSIGTMLVPAGRLDAVQAALGAIWPQTDLLALDWHGVPRRARWLCWIGPGTQRFAEDDFLVATRGGVLLHRIDLVPHARVQSVSIDQGPLQRRLRLATLAIHTSPGAVHWTRRWMEPEDAGLLCHGEVEQCRRAAAMTNRRSRAASQDPDTVF